MAKVVEIQQTNVYHKSDTATEKPSNFSSWLSYWKHWTNTQENTEIQCVIQNCSNEASVGAHIQLTQGKDYPVYIIPTCQSCNSCGIKNPQMQVNRGIKAVSVE